MHPEDLEKLVTLQMPFGKHKGCLLADLPGNYLNCFGAIGQPDRPPALIAGADGL